METRRCGGSRVDVIFLDSVWQLQMVFIDYERLMQIVLPIAICIWHHITYIVYISKLYIDIFLEKATLCAHTQRIVIESALSETQPKHIKMMIAEWTLTEPIYPSILSPSLDHNSTVLTANTEQFIIGQRVWVGGLRSGQIAYIGETHFAPGDWAGIVLDEPNGEWQLRAQTNSWAIIIDHWLTFIFSICRQKRWLCVGQTLLPVRAKAWHLLAPHTSYHISLVRRHDTHIAVGQTLARALAHRFTHSQCA